MKKRHPKPDISGLSGNELTAYLSLLENAPLNGSQLSKLAGISRPNAYDAMRSLKAKGYICEIKTGNYIPLPPEEFLRRVQQRCTVEINALREKLYNRPRKEFDDYIWTIHGYDEVMDKAISMIEAAQKDIYVLIYPKEAKILDPHLLKAVECGIDVKYVSMGQPANAFEFQITHHNSREIQDTNQGRIFDIVMDKAEVLVGMFRFEDEDRSPINWAKNNWFVQSVRESVRHDFFHCMMHKVFTLGQTLDENAIQMYHRLENDAWGNEYKSKKISSGNNQLATE